MDNRRRSAAVGVGSVALVVTALVAIGVDSRADQRGVCVDRNSSTRVADDECDDDSNGGAHGWYYIRSGRDAPAVGERVSGQGSYSVPPSASVAKGGVSSDGGTVTRGGFFSGKSSFGG